MGFLKCVLAILEKNFGSMILAIAIIIAACIYVYFSPYHSCKRDLPLKDLSDASFICLGQSYR